MNNKADVKGSKEQVTIRSDKEYMTYNKGLRVLTALKAFKGTNTIVSTQ